jgi:hypothetical protein
MSNVDINRLSTGPSTDLVRKQKEATGQVGKYGRVQVKVGEVLPFGENKHQPSVEEARAAMIAAGEAPKGSPNEAKKAGTRVAAPVATEIPVTGFQVKIKYSNGQTEEFAVADKITMERELRRRQTQIAARGLTAEVEYKPLGEETEEEQEVGPEPVAAVEPAPVPVVENTRGEGGSTRTEAQSERVENNKFILEIKQEDGQWVGEITFKNGAGTERFEAPTRKALDMKLLEGKANATLRVREVVRREKLGVDLDQNYEIPGYTQETYDALSEAARQLVIDAIAAKAALTFRETQAAFYGTADNSAKLQKFLFKKNLPITVRNLQYAFEELTESEELELRPEPKVSVSVSAPTVQPSTGDSVAAAVPAAVPAPAATPAPAPAPAVRKRGSMGLKPGLSSVSTDIEAEESNKPKEPSEQELRTMPLDQLRTLARKGYSHRQF